MATIMTAIKIQDAMTAPLQRMNNVLNVVINSFETMQTASSNAVDTANLEYARNELTEVALEINNIENNIANASLEQENFNNLIQEGEFATNGLLGKVKNLATAYLGIQGARSAVGFISDSIELANIQNASETQLRTVLANVGATADAYDMLYEKASEIQSRGIYGDEAMLGGASEIATYISDANAIASMMDTLSNYAMGMSGGGEVNKSAMVEYATQLGKALDGTYDGLTKKGFVLSDVQKKIIENGTDMEKALVLDDVISQSWENLYQTMSNTPESQIIRLSNTWGDIKETVGNGVYPAILKMFNAIQENMPVIQQIVSGFTIGMYYIISGLTQIINLVARCTSFISNNWSIIGPIIAGIVVAFIAYNSVLAIHAISLGISTAAQWFHNIATVAQAKALLANVNTTLLATNTKYALAVATAEATVAQAGFNTSLLACPITWIIIGIITVIALIYAVVGVINKVTGSSISATGIIMGVIFTLGAFIYNTFIVPVWNAIAALVNFFANCFKDPVASVKILFGEMAIWVLNKVKAMIEGIEDLINLIPWVQIDITSGIGNFIAEAEKGLSKIKSEAEWKDFIEYKAKKDYGDAYNAGYKFGQDIQNKISGMFSKAKGQDEDDKDKTGYKNILDNLNNNVNTTANNTGSIANSLDMTEEDLQYLRDIAEREAINRFTTAEIKLDFTNTNKIENDTDLDGIVNKIRDTIHEAVISSAEEVHA